MLPHVGQPVEIVGKPLEESRAAMIMVHGRGAAPRNILELADVFDTPGFTYLAPAAANNTWYPFSFMAETAKNEPGITSGLALLDQIVNEVIEQGIGRENIVLLGFSQGACLAAEYAVRHAGRYGGVIVYSGGLIGPPGTTWPYDGSFDGTPVFIGCSDVDAHIPMERLVETVAVFERMGAEVTKRFYPGMGHLINDDEIAFTRDLMQRIAADV